MTSPIDKTYAEWLAGEVIEQFEEMPLAVNRLSIDKNKLAGILMQATGFEHRKRMQFPIPKSEANQFHKDNPAGKLRIATFYPRRIIANYDTGYEPSIIERGLQTKENNVWAKRQLSFYSEVIFRKLRTDPEITKIRQRSLEAGNPFSVGVHFSTHLNFKEEPPYYGGDHEFHVPLIFIPGATKEDLDILAKFSIREQNPKHETYAHALENLMFERRLYKEDSL